MGEREGSQVPSEDSGVAQIRSLEIGATQIRLGEEGTTEIGTTEVPIGEGKPRNLFEPVRSLGFVITAQCGNDLCRGVTSQQYLTLEL